MTSEAGSLPEVSEAPPEGGGGLKRRRTLMRQRARWLDALDVEGKEETLFELEMLLKALNRYFRLENLLLSKPDEAIARNFSQELRIVRNAAARAAALARQLLSPQATSAAFFQSYVTQQLMGDLQRDLTLARDGSTEDPQMSLTLLALNLLSFVEMLDHLLKLRSHPYPLFHHAGQILGHVIAMSRHFDPVLLPAFLPQFDRITNPELAAAIKKVEPDEVRRGVSLVVLAMLRLLHVLRYAKSESEREEDLRGSLLLFALVQSDARALALYLEGDFAAGGAPGDLVELAQSIAYQLRMESKKAFGQILRDAAEIAQHQKLQSAVDQAKGTLTNFFQQSIVNLIRWFQGTIAPERIFPDFTSVLEQSLRLREDLWIFREVLESVEKRLTEGSDPAGGAGALGMVSDFILYFQNLSFPLVRFADREQFDNFFERMGAVRAEELKNRRTCQDLAREINHFKLFLEAILGHIQNRQELRALPLDEEHARTTLKQFLRVA